MGEDSIHSNYVASSLRSRQTLIRWQSNLTACDGSNWSWPVSLVVTLAQMFCFGSMLSYDHGPMDGLLLRGVHVVVHVVQAVLVRVPVLSDSGP